MLIGIVSKVEHCAFMERGLTDDGHDIRLLGGGTVSIPNALSVVVLRTKSCSHLASSIAFKWGREPGHYLIVENGLTGVRRELDKIALLIAPPPKPVVKGTMQVRATPTSVPFTVHALPPPPIFVMPAVPEAPVPSIAKEASVVKYLLPKDVPKGVSWTSSKPVARLERDVSKAWEVVRGLSAEDTERIVKAFHTFNGSGFLEVGPGEMYFRSSMAKNPDFANMKGHPIQFLAVVLMVLDKEETIEGRTLLAAYAAFNDEKATNAQTVQSVAWATERKVEFTGMRLRGSQNETTPEPAPIPSPVPEPLLAPVPPPPPVRPEPAPVFPLQERIPTDVADQRKEVQALRAENEELRRQYAQVLVLLETHGPVLVELTKRLKALEEREDLAERVAALEEKSSQPSKDSVLDVMDLIRARGGDITLSFARSKE